MRTAIVIAFQLVLLGAAFGQPMPSAAVIAGPPEPPQAFKGSVSWQASGTDATGLRLSVSNVATNYNLSLPVTARSNAAWMVVGERNDLSVDATNAQGKIVGGTKTAWWFWQEKWVRWNGTFEQTTNFPHNWQPLAATNFASWKLATGAQWLVRPVLVTEMRTNGKGSK